MHRLLYISTARKPLSPLEIEGILRTSRRNNAAADVTGLLVVGGNRFLQVLEGPSEGVRATFDRITRDTRHFAAVKLADEAIDGRMFANWAMGHQSVDPVSASALPADALSMLVGQMSNPTIRAYFEDFAIRHTVRNAPPAAFKSGPGPLSLR